MQLSSIPLDRSAKVQSLLLKEDWLENHNVKFGNYSIDFTGLQKVFIISDTDVTKECYHDVYDEGIYVGEEIWYKEVFPNTFNHSYSPEEIVELIKDSVED